MIRNSLLNLRRRLGRGFLLLSLAATGISLTSCTTEEGVVAGALAGAALGGVIGHSSERSYRNNRHSRNYDNRYYNDRSYSQRSYYPQQRYSSYGNGGGYRDPYCY